MSLDPALARAAIEVLARPPRPPRDPGLFTSDPLFGQPGIYPQGPAMAPASGPPRSDAEVRREVDTLLDRAPDAGPARRRFDDPALAAAAPDAAIRGALVVLAATVGAPVLHAFPTGTTASRLQWGTPDSPGRVVGPAGADAGLCVVNDRYRAEHPALLAGSLAHDLLWTPSTSGHAAETVLHALVAMVHLQLVARRPELAHAGTELARRQNSLAITLLHSRRPGSSRISLCAPDAPGTIPGGAPSMQTPDFWSVPFGPPGDSDAPPLLAAVLGVLTKPGVVLPVPLRFDEGLGAWLDEHLADAWLPLPDHVRAAAALGVLDGADIATAAGMGVDHVVDAFGLRAVRSCFE